MFACNGAKMCWLWRSRGTLVSGRIYELLLDARLDVGEVTEVRFRWNNHIIDPLRPKFGAEKVVLQRGKDKET